MLTIEAPHGARWAQKGGPTQANATEGSRHRGFANSRLQKHVRLRGCQAGTTATGLKMSDFGGGFPEAKYQSPGPLKDSARTVTAKVS